MSNNSQDWKDLGSQILDSVAGALNTGDFRQLNNLVSGTVNNVVQEAKKQAEIEKLTREEILRQYRENNAANYEKWQQQQQELNRRKEERREEWRKIREAQNYRYAQNRAAVGQNGTTLPPPPKFRGVRFNKVGNVASVLNTVFGSIGLGVGASLALVSLILLTSGGTWLPVGIVTAVILGVSTSMMSRGAKQRGLIKRAQRYMQICGTKMYADIDEIALQTGNSSKFVRKDLKKMLRKGMFPEGHLDRQETCFMLSNEVYRQYTETAEAFRMREQMKAESTRQKTIEEEAQEIKNQQEVELNAMMAEGMTYIQKLRALNEAIPGAEITSQLSQLESLLRQIFDRVKEHPEQMNRMHKLMEYYLPTTVKLMEAYVQFEKVENPGQDIRDAKAEIQKTLGIINEAFTELLNNLFQDEVFDATTDAQVLQAMLSREGLRREMGLQPVGSDAEEDDALEEDEEEEEENPFRLTLEPEQPEVLPSLKAPWES